MKNQLEELRRQHAIRQEDLAQALGVSRQTVISLEKGKYNPSLALAFKPRAVFQPVHRGYFRRQRRLPRRGIAAMNTPPCIGRPGMDARRILL